MFGPKIDLRMLDDPNRFVTGPVTPLLDQHELVDPEKGMKVKVDAAFLNDVARNANARATTKGNPVPIIVGHTEDGGEERPVVGYYVNLRTVPNPERPDELILVGTPKVRRNRARVLEDFPRRSVELWVGRREIDPVALLGGTTPERDLGDQAVIRYSRDGGGHYRYAMDEGETMPTPMPTQYGHSEHAGMKACYSAADDTGTSDTPPDEGGEPEVVAQVKNSAWGKSLDAKVDKILSLLEGGGEGEPDGDEVPADLDGGDGLMGGPGDGMPPGGDAPMGGGMPMGGEGGEWFDDGDYDDMPPGGHEPEAREFHEPPPVRFNAGGGMGYPSGTSGFVPGHEGKTRMNRSTYGGYGYGYQPQPVVGLDRDSKVRMQRLEKENADIRLKLARSEARELITQLEQDGYQFADRGRTEQQLVTLAQVGPKAVEAFVNDIKANYRRQDADPASPLGLMRFARDGEKDGTPQPRSMEDVQRVVARLRPGQSFDDGLAALYGQQPQNGHANGAAQGRR